VLLCMARPRSIVQYILQAAIRGRELNSKHLDSGVLVRQDLSIVEIL